MGTRRSDDAPLEEDEIEQLARQRERLAGYREAACRALAFARRYRAEEGAPGGSRERSCIEQARVWRRAVAEAHAGVSAIALPGGARPGLARARRDGQELEAAASKTGDGRKTG